MSTEHFVATNIKWVAGLIVTSVVLAGIIMRSYSKAIQLLKLQIDENKKLLLQIEELETDRTDALEHLNTSNNRKLKSHQISHSKWMEDQRSAHTKEVTELKAVHAITLKGVRTSHSKAMEVISAGHIKELLKLKTDYAKTMADLKASNIKTQEAMKEGYINSIEEQKIAHTKLVAQMKQHYQSDLDKRRHIVEGKREKYENFLRICDQFDTDNNYRLNRTGVAILDDFQRNYLQAINYHNKKNADNAVKVATKRMEKLLHDAQKDHMVIGTEMNALRLIMNDEGMEMMNELYKTYNTYMDVFSKLMKGFIPCLVKQQMEKISAWHAELAEASNGLINAKAAIAALGREEAEDSEAEIFKSGGSKKEVSKAEVSEAA